LVKPVKDLQRVRLDFPIPDYQPQWRAKPGTYLSHLIGHESEGSVLSCLKQRGLATSLSAGPMHFGSGFDIFSITIDLTKQGLGASCAWF
jgi:insulysin